MSLTKEDTIKRIERYLQRNDAHPRLVNVNNPDATQAICQYFNVGSNVLKSVADFSSNDENLSEDALYNYLATAKGAVFVTGLTSYYRLFGEDSLQDFLNRIISTSLSGLHLIVICYQCEKYLKNTDRRYAQFVYLVDGQKAELPRLTFVKDDILIPDKSASVDGIEYVPAVVEKGKSLRLLVHTKKRKSSYPRSMYGIKEINDSFEVLCDIDATTEQLKKKYGSEEEWKYALSYITRHGSWMKYITDIFKTTTNLDMFVGSWSTFDANKKWLYFIALKLYGTKDNWCLTEAIKNADNSNLFIRCVFRSILHASHKDKAFWEHYDERKKLIHLLGNPDAEVADYCAMVKRKGEDVLYYLTDASKAERNLIFENLDAYSEKIGRKNVEEILRHIYPGLYAYLQPYRFNIQLLDSYFQEYKYQKVVNKVFPDFMQLVEEQAEKREFNLLLPARSEKLDAIPKNDTLVYFVDAMGVEYLSYIMDQCQKKKLLAYVTLCHCELPSITSFNKEFVDVLMAGGAEFLPDKNGVKSLDDLKHHGVEEFDYTNNALPTYIPRELEIITQTIEKIATKLMNGTYKRAIMISDHGASRLSVISHRENMWGSESNAQHSGRCCPVSEIDEKPACAIEENGFWVLANYDRFKGSRKANVEVHGGATLEEVVVPIIEISYSPNEIEIQLLDKNIKFSRRKKDAAIRLFSKTKLDSLTIRISGLERECEGESHDGQTFTFVLPELRKAGEYTVDVYYNNNLLKTGLVFTANNSDFSERKLL